MGTNLTLGERLYNLRVAFHEIGLPADDMMDEDLVFIIDDLEPMFDPGRKDLHRCRQFVDLTVINDWIKSNRTDHAAAVHNWTVAAGLDQENSTLFQVRSLTDDELETYRKNRSNTDPEYPRRSQNFPRQLFARMIRDLFKTLGFKKLQVSTPRALGCKALIEYPLAVAALVVDSLEKSYQFDRMIGIILDKTFEEPSDQLAPWDIRPNSRSFAGKFYENCRQASARSHTS